MSWCYVVDSLLPEQTRQFPAVSDHTTSCKIGWLYAENLGNVGVIEDVS